MTDKVNYSIIQDEKGAISVQSTVKSFNLDHVTTKEIVSFYQAFSTYAAHDTGLLPLDGTGILSLRSAGHYTQFAYQHKPGLYLVNWGAQEGDRYAHTYYVAQPYRIIICDMENGNLLGARMFYSPYPITTPSQPLYHVNLPNINCKGYRGNGVGWICLYKNEDWSSLPLNERITRFVERCSGVETYNDANMSETDGTRFYQESGKPSYIWDPVEWQQKSSDEGYEWTLDPDLWIPVLVKSMDDQKAHFKDGQPLTFADALVGDYQAYYDDRTHTKPINALIRPDRSLSSEEVLSYFVASYINSSKTSSLLNDTFNASQTIKDKTGSSVFVNSPLLAQPQDDEDLDTCPDCEESHHSDNLYPTAYNTYVCQSCLDNGYIYVESANKHFHTEDDSLYYIESQDKWYHTSYDEHVFCDICSDIFFLDNPNSEVNSFTNGLHICKPCLPSYVEENSIEHSKCDSCGTIVCTQPDHLINTVSYTSVTPKFISKDQNETAITKSYLCTSCATDYFVCPCGYVKPSSLKGIEFNPCNQTCIDGVEVSACCASCLGSPYEKNGVFVADFVPENKDVFDAYQKAVSKDVQFLSAGIILNDLF